MWLLFTRNDMKVSASIPQQQLLWRRHTYAIAAICSSKFLNCFHFPVFELSGGWEFNPSSLSDPKTNCLTKYLTNYVEPPPAYKGVEIVETIEMNSNLAQSSAKICNYLWSYCRCCLFLLLSVRIQPDAPLTQVEEIGYRSVRLVTWWWW